MERECGQWLDDKWSLFVVPIKRPAVFFESRRTKHMLLVTCTRIVCPRFPGGMSEAVDTEIAGCRGDL
jgi:hypothetical protein